MKLDKKLQTILKEYGWKNQCKIQWGPDGMKHSIWHGCNRKGKPNKIEIRRSKNKGRIWADILHECHHVIFETGPNRKDWRSYLREYRIEKQVRNIARKYKLDSVLKDSNRFVKFYINTNPNKWISDAAGSSARCFKQHLYAAKRINREEKLGY